MEPVFQPALIFLLSVLTLEHERCQPRCACGRSLRGSGWACWFLLSRLAARSISQRREQAALSSAGSDWAGGFESLLSATIILADPIHLQCLQFWFLREQRQGYSVTKSLLKAKYDFEQKTE